MPLLWAENKCRFLTHGYFKDKVITLENCEKILNKGTRKYTKEEIRQIREYLFFIGQLELENSNTVN